MTPAALAPGARLCFVADGRSPIARNWMGHFVERGFEVHLISTFPVDAQGMGLASVEVVPIAFASFAGATSGLRPASAGAPARMPGWARRLRTRAVGTLFPTVFGWLAPPEVARHAARVRERVERVDPVLVHAMRIPYEGVVAARALEGSPLPLVVSVWGNDLELWASRYPLVSRATRRALARASALHPDCARDLLLAGRWGWDASRPSVVLPGNGGIRTERFHPGPSSSVLNERLGIPDGAPVVLNPRGFREYVRNEAFFAAIPPVLERHPHAVFVGVGMQGNPRALRWTRELGIEHAVRLTPLLSPDEIAQLFRRATLAVSPSQFDGTPNTLLETMACGAFPVAGDIASVREWITDGQNGLLCDPADPAALAAAISRGLEDEQLRRAAAERNAALVAQRAEFGEVMRRAEAFYARVVNGPLPG